MYRYLKSKAGKNIPQPKQNRSSLGEIRNGTRRRYNESFKRRGSLINAFTRGKQRTQHRTKIKTGSRADVIAAATKDLDVQKLDTKQKEVLDLILEGKNVFFTGSAGTGKSHVLRLAVKHLEAIFPRKVHITAPTGVAACNIGGLYIHDAHLPQEFRTCSNLSQKLVLGTTIHSFSGIGLGDGDKETLLRRVRSKRIARRRWQEAKVLVIDEISMLSASLFDTLAYIAQRIRSCMLPFGGLQLVLCGDFFQLPPVKAQRLCFQSERFQHCVKRKIVLKQNFRQKDSKLITILNQIRTGIVTSEAERILQGTAKQNLDSKDSVVPTRLFSHNTQVNQANEKAFRFLQGKTCTFEADDYGDKFAVKSLQKNCQALQMLQLKVGAQVILLKNLSIESGLVNGSQGIVLEFRAERGEGGEEDRTLYPFVEFTTPHGKCKRLVTREEWTIQKAGETVATRSQVPLRLAWGLSIHKSQGMTIKKLEVNLDKIFEPGQAYVALSRCTSLGGLRVLGFTRSKIRADPRVISFHREMGDLLQSSPTSPPAKAVADSSGSLEQNNITPRQQCFVDLTEEEAIMREYGAYLEAETGEKPRQSQTTMQSPHKKPQRETRTALDPDDEEAMIMAEYSAACAEEIPDEFLSSAMHAKPSPKKSSVVMQKTTQKAGRNVYQPSRFASGSWAKTPTCKQEPAKGSPNTQGKCFSCGQAGHWAANCPLKSNRKRKAEGSFRASSNGWISKRATSVCFRCKQVGHYASACPTKNSPWFKR